MSPATPKPTLVPVRSGRAFEAVVEQLRDALLAGTWEAGDRLPTERDLAALFRVSRTVVREALRVLELSGLLVVRHGGISGVFVAPAPPRPLSLALRTLLKDEMFSIPELFAVNVFLEQRIAEEAARVATEEDLARLQENVITCQRLLDRGTLPVDEVLDFHRTLAGILGNRLLAELERALADAAGRVQSSRVGDDRVYQATVVQHREILEALKARKPRQAGKAMALHLKTVETIFLRDGAAVRAPNRETPGQPRLRAPARRAPIGARA